MKRKPERPPQTMLEALRRRFRALIAELDRQEREKQAVPRPPIDELRLPVSSGTDFDPYRSSLVEPPKNGRSQ